MPAVLANTPPNVLVGADAEVAKLMPGRAFAAAQIRPSRLDGKRVVDGEHQRLARQFDDRHEVLTKSVFTLKERCGALATLSLVMRTE